MVANVKRLKCGHKSISVYVIEGLFEVDEGHVAWFSLRVALPDEVLDVEDPDECRPAGEETELVAQHGEVLEAGLDDICEQFICAIEDGNSSVAATVFGYSYKLCCLPTFREQ